MLLTLLETCGRHARWVLPIGLVVGALFPWASEPMQASIAPSIWLLLFLAVIRLHSGGALGVKTNMGVRDFGIKPLMARIALAQLLFPLLVFFATTLIGLPVVWCVSATLVAAAPPISGSPSLVLLLKGDGTLALRWLIAATLLLPITCIPVIYLLLGEQSTSQLLLPVAKLLLLIISASCAGVFVNKALESRHISPSTLALDGAASITLALMVVGLMSGIHAPGIRVEHLLITLAVALAINLGYQILGATIARALKHTPDRIICTGVINGNRNIALYLAALPVSFTEPLLLFIACYQIPMYLTPLIGAPYYRLQE